MKLGDLVKSCYHDRLGIVIEAGNKPDRITQLLAARVKWCDGDESIEWIKFLRLINAATN